VIEQLIAGVERKVAVEAGGGSLKVVAVDLDFSRRFDLALS